MSKLKEALSSSVKPDTTHCRRAIKVYVARACEYGDAKYERSNYLQPAKDTKEDFLRLRAYLRACSDHIDKTLSSMELHQMRDPDLVDERGMRCASAAEDSESGLSHLAHTAASLMMGLEQAVLYKLLPEDPGRPWEKTETKCNLKVKVPLVYPTGWSVTLEIDGTYTVKDPNSLLIGNYPKKPDAVRRAERGDDCKHQSTTSSV